MTANLAIDYITKRMAEVGNVQYTVRFRHFLLQPGQTITIPSFRQFFLLIDPYDNIRVESDVGIFDLSEDLANELQYEHQGFITITNLSIITNHARFIQVIPQQS